MKKGKILHQALVLAAMVAAVIGCAGPALQDITEYDEQGRQLANVAITTSGGGGYAH